MANQPRIWRIKTIPSMIWKAGSENGVEGDGEDDAGNGQKSAVPPFIDVCWVIEDDQTPGS